MRIDVTEEDIRMGVRGDCGYCPVARAIHRQTGVEVAVENDGQAVVYIFNRRIKLLPAVGRFIRRFDDLEVEADARLLYIEPFSFELPDAFLNAITP